MAKGDLFVYGVFVRVIEDERQALVKLYEDEFAELLERLLETSDGDVRVALKLLKEEVARRLRQTL